MNSLLLNSCKSWIHHLIIAKLPKQVEERSLDFSQSPSSNTIIVWVSVIAAVTMQEKSSGFGSDCWLSVVLEKKKLKITRVAKAPFADKKEALKCPSVGLQRVFQLSIFLTLNASHKVPNRRPSCLFAYQPAAPDTHRQRHAEIRAFRGSASLITSSREGTQVAARERWRGADWRAHKCHECSVLHRRLFCRAHFHVCGPKRSPCTGSALKTFKQSFQRFQQKQGSTTAHVVLNNVTEIKWEKAKYSSSFHQIAWQSVKSGVSLSHVLYFPIFIWFDLASFIYLIITAL